ncbi:MAG: hypothetical protein WA252_03045 [Candidatus Sulfotelmatobacter sp.]
MTIDERLDRLTERHEALTQSLELISQMTHDNERQVSESTRQIRELRDAAGALLQIAQIRENRISGLEGGQ